MSRGEQGNLETSVYRKPTHTDKYLAFDSHQPIFHKKSAAKTLLRRADCLPSSLDSKAEERKYVSNVLKANGNTKTFLRNCQEPVTTSSTPDEREPATGFAIIPYIQGVTEPIKRILMTTNTSDRPKSVWYTFEGASKSGFLLQRIKIYRDNGGLLPDAHLHLVGKKKTSELAIVLKDILLQRLDHS